MKRKNIYPILVALVVLAFYFINDKIDSKQAQENYEEKASPSVTTNVNYLPSSTTNYVVHHNNYSLSYNEEHEQAEWVAYELKKSHLSRNKFKRPLFYQDKSIKTKSAHWRNFKNSGYDKGHLCPAGDRRFSKQAHDETFLTSNISPQEHQFNAGVWNRLEQKVRYWAKKYNGVYVVTGGVLSDNLKGIGSEEVSVPKYFYKVLLDNDNGEVKMIAFLIPHRDTSRPLYEYVVSVDKIESLTGIDFFPQLTDNQQEKLEALEGYKGWSFR